MFRLCVLLLVALNLADGVYFTMSDVEMNLPGDRGKLLSRNHALVTLYALPDDPKTSLEQYLRYSIADLAPENYLQIYPTTGDLMFAEGFFRNSSDAVTVEAIASVQDNAGNDSTTFRINIGRPRSLDCDLIINDLCFWQSASYRIFENRQAGVIGTLSSSYLAEMCAGYKINYTLLRGENQFELVTPPNNNKSWAVRSLQPLDRDVQRSVATFHKKSSTSGEFLEIAVKCSVENPAGTERDITKNVSIKILDEDDNPPVAKLDVLNVPFPSDVIIKGELVAHKDLIITDRDSPQVNHYDMRLLNDNLDILKLNCSTFVDDRHGEQQTAIHCKFTFTKTMQMPKSYSVILQINDTTLLPGYGNRVVRVPINLHFKTASDFFESSGEGSEPEELRKPLRLYPIHEVQVYRTASILTRLTQPDSTKLRKRHLTHFTITNTSDNVAAFRITSNGIVYVHDVILLRKSSTPIRLNITWRDGNKTENDEIYINITSEPNPTCSDRGPLVDNWSFCAQFVNPSSCKKACGLSTGGPISIERRRFGLPERCMWRGDPNGGTHESKEYSTCTHDIKTCPDGICDSLEELHPLICPLDCSKNVYFPTSLNRKTGRGIDIAAGICSCDETNKCGCHYRQVKTKTSKKPPSNTTAVPPVVASNATTFAQPSRHVGADLAKCGTACMLSIVAAVLFLLGAVAVVVICWRMDRMQKAVRKKFSEDTQDLSAPLSDYIDRNQPPDSLHVNFDMTTALNGHAHKIPADPKWEFPRSQLIIEQTLGEGEFGRVLRAKAKDIVGQSGYTTVAVKTLKDDAREPELADLLSEYELLKEVSHPNIIRLLGASTLPGGPIYLIIEFAEHGSLRSYLRKCRQLKSEFRHPSVNSDNANEETDPNLYTVTPRDILAFAWQISNGMAYLSDIKLVHRDLAARNILLAGGKICKISDFGLTRDIYEDDAYFKKSKGRVPVKWMAPESLSDHIYTSKSDVWSFGILIWELVTLGATPYPGIAVQNLFHLLKSGYRMERPENCSLILYKIMRSCWHIEPDQRPQFFFLSAQFEKMLSEEVEYLDLTSNAVHNRAYFCSTFDETDGASEKKCSSEAINYLDKSKQYTKCGESDKLLLADDSEIPSTQGYETPIKVKQQTPSNECPQYGYTDMGSVKSH